MVLKEGALGPRVESGAPGTKSMAIAGTTTFEFAIV
jgi:hypothetical protein